LIFLSNFIMDSSNSSGASSSDLFMLCIIGWRFWRSNRWAWTRRQPNDKGIN